MLGSYVTKKRDKAAALAFLKRALKRHGRAETLVTDGLRSYPTAMPTWVNSIPVNAADDSTSGRRRIIFPTPHKAVDAEIPQDKTPAEIRVHPRRHRQSLRPRTPHHQPSTPQGTSLRRTGRVTEHRCRNTSPAAPKRAQ
ncbi:transposase [Sphingomonas colocasiae]|uniref:Transposase n=1 Tax=Sphingomonas colocasiae TaxID=1848973 RepID=A0ABS7Q008_9SPHN|nr:transposase [Sphingomonas colocasiae]